MDICYGCFNTKAAAGPCPRCGYDPAEAAQKHPLALRPGSVLNGRYVVGRVLGQGGFGITYIAWDDHTHQKVAIKEYLPTDYAGRTTGTCMVSPYSSDREEFFRFGMEQFLKEAKTLAAFIGDKHIVRIYSYFEENATAYFTMEYVEGLPLNKYMATRGGRLTVEEADELLLPIMEALDTVHAKGIVHRDIAPDNIIITPEHKAKLIDFGAARYSTGEKSKSLDVVIKHGFAPREQYARHGRQGPFTDVYAMAATYYYAITGKVPPDAIDRMEEDNLVLPSTLGVSIDSHTEAALCKGLELSAAYRYQTMEAFRTALSASESARVEQEWEAAERARREKEAAERARLEQERQEKEAAEKARKEKERREQETAEKARREREAAEKARREREAAEKARREREAAEKARREKEAAEKARRDAEAQKQPSTKQKKSGSHPVLRLFLIVFALLVLRSVLFGGDSGGSNPVLSLVHTHEWGAWTVSRKATCEEDGEERRVCSLNSSHVETRAIPALGHELSAATYDAPPTCTRCGKQIGTVKGYIGTLEGSWESGIPVANQTAAVFTPSGPVINCRQLTLHVTFESASGNPEGTWLLMGKKSNGKWDTLGTFTVTKDAVTSHKELVNAYTFAKGKSIYALAVIRRGSLGFNVTYSVDFTDCQVYEN